MRLFQVIALAARLLNIFQVKMIIQKHLIKELLLVKKTRNNELSYRTKGDVVSTFAQKTKTLDNPYKSLIDRFNPLKAHNVDNIKNNNIRV